MTDITVVVSGSRGINDYELLRRSFIMSCVWKKYKGRMKIIHGYCKNSPDMLADQFARNNSIPYERYPADWDTYGKRAGMLRNIEMADIADILIAIWDGSSKGTKQMIDYCEKIGLYCYVLNTSTGEIDELNKERLDDLR